MPSFVLAGKSAGNSYEKLPGLRTALVQFV